MANSSVLFLYWQYLASSVAVCLCVFIVRFIRHRRFYHELPLPPHGFVFGNLTFLGKTLSRYPKGTHPQIMFADIAREEGFRGIYYLDLYPAQEPILVILDHTVASQVQNWPRHHHSTRHLRAVVGTKSIFSIRGAEWHTQRRWFAPAFAMSHLITLVPDIVEEALIFREKLVEMATSKETFSMLDLTIRLTLDVISRTGFDLKLKSQTQDSPIYDNFQGAMNWMPRLPTSLFRRAITPFAIDYYSRKLDYLLRNCVKERYANGTNDKAVKSIIDLALHGYQKENDKLATSATKLDEKFLKIAVDNFKTFLGGGYDTTAITMTYTYYLLSTHLDILERVRKEHNDILGHGLEETIKTLQNTPHLINQLPLTLAILKETLRLFPIGFTVRQGAPGSTITFEGRKYPAGGHTICLLTSAMQRDGNIWQDPNEFNPDRFLIPGKTDNDAFQPFGKGLRHCIGQQHSIIEEKIVMVLTLRFFDFQPDYFDDSESIPNWGGKAFQIMNLTAKPKDGIPMKVAIRKEF